MAPNTTAESSCGSESGSTTGQRETGSACARQAFRQRLLRETGKATRMVVQFMLLAFVLEALITLYVPEAWIAGILGHNQPWAIVTAALLGVPVYTSNLAAMPLVGGLLMQVQHIPRADVTRLLANTYGGYLANQSNLKWRTEMEQTLDQLVERVIRLGLVEQVIGDIQLTLLGRACGRSSRSFQSAMRFVELLRKISLQGLTAKHLMALLQALPELDDT